MEMTCARYQLHPEQTLQEVAGRYGQDATGLAQTFHRMIITLMRDNDIQHASMRPIILRMQALISTERIPRAILDQALDRAAVPEDRIRNPRI